MATKKEYSFTLMEMLEWMAKQASNHPNATTRGQITKLVSGKMTPVRYMVQRGHVQLGGSWNGVRREGGWIPNQYGQLFVAVCECGAQTMEWSFENALSSLIKMRVQAHDGKHIHPKATGQVRAVPETASKSIPGAERMPKVTE